jgi:endonuclease/exonuclease/phosphatase family metal-dependent hydrolase
MNTKTHILITVIISIATLVICPLFYVSSILEADNTETPQGLLQEQIKADNLILAKSNEDLRIMTFNILAHYKSWGGTPVEQRCNLFFEVLNGFTPDVLGLQEMCLDWYNALTKTKSTYKFTSPVKTAFPHKMTAILYNSETLELIDCGSTPFTNSVNFKTRRIAWGLFKQKNTSECFYVVNTHFSFLEEKEKNENFPIQSCQANELYTNIKSLYSQYSYPIFIVGDFNTKRRVSYQKSVINSGSYGILNSLYTDSEDIAKNKYYGENFNFNNTLNDHIFIKGDVTVKNLSLLSQDCFCELSDHYPLFADIKL